MVLNLSPRPGRIFRRALILFSLCTSVDITSAQIFTPAERPNSLYRIAAGIYLPAGIVRRNEQLWVVGEYSHSLFVIQPDGRLASAFNGERVDENPSRDGRPRKGGCGELCFPVGIALDSNGFPYIGDSHHALVRKFLGRSVVTVAGNAYGCGLENAIKGRSLCHPAGVVVDTNDDLYIVDANLHIVRKVTFSIGEMKTVAGNAGCGGADGIGVKASLCRPRGIAIDAKNNLYVADTGNSTIRKITPEGVVSTVAGMAEICGSVDGGRAPDGTSTARFCEPAGIAVDNLTGNLYVADTRNATIRKITPDGQVTTVAGKAGIKSTALGALPGTIAKPRGIAVIGPNQLAISTEGNEVLGINF
jgi:DNA-binding beta-propeller fold protein YncE